MIISLYANKLGLSIRGSEILQKWLWLESRVIDCDSSRVESFCEKRDSSRVTIFRNVTRVESESPKIVTRVDSSQWLESRYHCQSCDTVSNVFWGNIDFHDRSSQQSYLKCEQYVFLFLNCLICFSCACNCISFNCKRDRHFAIYEGPSFVIELSLLSIRRTIIF